MSNCFASDSKKGCVALAIQECVGEKECSFFKTKEQNDRDIKHSYAKLRNLDKETQYKISKSYYYNSQIWNREKEVVSLDKIQKAETLDIVVKKIESALVYLKCFDDENTIGRFTQSIHDDLAYSIKHIKILQDRLKD